MISMGSLVLVCRRRMLSMNSLSACSSMVLMWMIYSRSFLERPEIGELVDELAHFLAAVNQHGAHLNGVGADGLHVVAVQPQHHVLNLVGNLVDALAEQDDVLPLDGGDEGPGQHVGELVLFLVGGMLHLMQPSSMEERPSGLKFFRASSR